MQHLSETPGPDRRLAIGTWNITGLTEEKLHCICEYMNIYGIGILCLLETRAPRADYFDDNGFRIILSGGDAEDESNWAGVGFIVAPWCRHLIHGFLQFSDRCACIKVKVRGGKIGIISAYAPHNLRPYDERYHFYQELGHLCDKCSVNGSLFLLGDFNARIGQRRPGEDDISQQTSI